LVSAAHSACTLIARTPYGLTSRRAQEPWRQGLWKRGDELTVLAMQREPGPCRRSRAVRHRDGRRVLTQANTRPCLYPQPIVRNPGRGPLSLGVSCGGCDVAAVAI